MALGGAHLEAGVHEVGAQLQLVRACECAQVVPAPAGEALLGGECLADAPVDVLLELEQARIRLWKRSAERAYG